MRDYVRARACIDSAVEEQSLWHCDLHSLFQFLSSSLTVLKVSVLP